VRSRNVLTIAAALLTLIGVAGRSHGTFATFSGATSNGGNTFSLTSLYAPGSLTATPTGPTVEVAWTPGQNGNGYKVLSAPAPDPLVNDCTGASYSEVTTTAGTAYTHSVSSPQGTWRCYTVRTSYHAWTSVESNPVAGARLGFVASVVTFANGGNAGRIDDGDVFTFTFNQAVDPATGPQAGNTICWQNGTIVLGSTGTGNCTQNEVPRLGVLTGGTIDRNFRHAATWAWSNGNRTLTVTVGARQSGSGNSTTGGSWTFNPTTNAALVRSATGGLHVCDTNAGGGNCLPNVSGL
jgi:hypothetical protein